MKKKPLYLLPIVILTALFVLCLPANAAETSGTTGDCTWELNGTAFAISGNGATGNHSNASWGTDITSVVIEDGVTTIGSYAFYVSPALPL